MICSQPTGNCEPLSGEHRFHIASECASPMDNQDGETRFRSAVAGSAREKGVLIDPIVVSMIEKTVFPPQLLLPRKPDKLLLSSNGRILAEIND